MSLSNAMVVDYVCLFLQDKIPLLKVQSGSLSKYFQSAAASGIVRASSVHFGLHPSPRGNHFWQTSNINNRIAPRPSRDLCRR